LGLGTRIIIENFLIEGKYESLRTELNKYVRWIIAFFGRHLARCEVDLARFSCDRIPGSYYIG